MKSSSSVAREAEAASPGSIGFGSLGVLPRFAAALKTQGIVEPSDIQRELIPPALAGRDVVGQARTGTGKTLAFALPIVQRLEPKAGLQSLVLVPTRELATQVVQEIKRVAEEANLRVVAVYGGQEVRKQLALLKPTAAGGVPEIVVGTPGRVMDFMQRGALPLVALRVAVLDEVDRMLDIGFRDDIRRILSKIEAPHQTIVVSATIDNEIRRLIDKYTQDAVRVDVSRDVLTVDQVDQFYVSVARPDKPRLLEHILREYERGSTIVFTNTKAAARRLCSRLKADGYDAMEIHGDLFQRKRERVLERFRKGRFQLLVATDLAARGLDVSGITHIINYDIPENAEVYVHRIGRTARMGQSGTAITFVTFEEGKQITAIEHLINKEILPRRVEGFESSVAPPQAPVADEQAVPSTPPIAARFVQSAYAEGDATTAASSTPRRTLGGKFRPSRTRRLR
ncbi:MAG: DEAD/DEAH box helicase [Phycisphaerae bacterium]